MDWESDEDKNAKMQKILRREELITITMMIIETLLEKGMALKEAVIGAREEAMTLIAFFNEETPL